MNQPHDQDGPQAVARLHSLYCHWTGQDLTLRFDRQRLWHEFLRAGFTPENLKAVIAYLQKQIRMERRNPGALKLSNLLQLDRFEEDLNISRARLSLPRESPKPAVQTQPPSPDIDQQHRDHLLRQLRSFRQRLRSNDH
jgi:hypothetical protein